MILDAATNSDQPMSTERLFGWHTALFPTGRSGLHRLRVGAWRTDESGPMQVVSGRVGREKVHFEAPPADRVDAEIARFLDWFNQDSDTPAVVKAGLAHLWFVTIHPFDDGSGRIARALGDLWLARSDESPRRFYSLSAQIQRDRHEYYTILEATQRGSLDVTEWLVWFLETLCRAIDAADRTVDDVLAKARFWHRWSEAALNPRQIMLLNRLLDGDDRKKLTSSRWAHLTRCSQDTALRDINELVHLGILTRSSAGGRSTSYELLDSSP
ncbi:Fic family protein [Nocardia stercoris]|nr:Fic family protein [Nocardia stercoris]